MSADTLYANLLRSWEETERATALESVEDYAAGIEDQFFAAAKIADSLWEDVATVRRVLAEAMAADPELDALDEISDLFGEIDRQASDLATELQADLTERRARFVTALDTLGRGVKS